MPASAMPETKQSSATGRLNSLLSTLMRKATAELRRLNESGKNESHLRRYKEDVLADVYKLLICTYGTPPDEFVFRYKEPDADDKDDDDVEGEHEAEGHDDDSEDADADDKNEKDEKESKQLIDHAFTPQSFYSEYYGEQMPDWAALSHNPAMDYNTLYTFEGGRNVFEEPDLQVLNLPIEKLKEYT